MTYAVEAVIHEKEKINKGKVKCYETEVFCDPNIVD